VVAPDVILGDRYGASAPAAFTYWAETAFSDANFTVARNAPYAGGHTTALYARRNDGCYALQIEIARAL
jgi:N-formylglutamate amidohydrolase